MPQLHPAVRRAKSIARNILLLFVLAFLLPLATHGLWTLTPDNVMRGQTANWTSAAH